MLKDQKSQVLSAGETTNDCMPCTVFEDQGQAYLRGDYTTNKLDALSYERHCK